MKKLLTLIIVFSVLSSCNQKRTENTQTDIKLKTELTTEAKSEPIMELSSINSIDTINNYWALELDTISSKKEFKIDELKYTLALKTYSLNDSSIVRNLSQKEGHVYLDHSHKKVTQFKLSNDSLLSLEHIDRTDFEESLFPEFYVHCNLYATEIDSVSGNIIYLTSDLAVPDTDNQWRVWYSIKINDNRFGELEIKETDYVGL